ncbi:MAG TPA: hypothetical protein VJI75_01815 [Candidatus Nanoarchaeia archaeon]|nr:hypothetical protein [Candidatus Nanoarchaeia archaeon]
MTSRKIRTLSVIALLTAGAIAGRMSNYLVSPKTLSHVNYWAGYDKDWKKGSASNVRTEDNASAIELTGTKIIESLEREYGCVGSAVGYQTTRFFDIREPDVTQFPFNLGDLAENDYAYYCNKNKAPSSSSIERHLFTIYKNNRWEIMTVVTPLTETVLQERVERFLGCSGVAAENHYVQRLRKTPCEWREAFTSGVQQRLRGEAEIRMRENCGKFKNDASRYFLETDSGHLLYVVDNGDHLNSTDVAQALKGF